MLKTWDVKCLNKAFRLIGDYGSSGLFLARPFEWSSRDRDPGVLEVEFSGP